MSCLGFFVPLHHKTIKEIKIMIKGTYTMEIDIEYEFDDSQISACDATDLIDYFANAKVTLENDKVNILNATLTSKY